MSALKETMEMVYEDAIKSCEFKYGDSVKILRKAENGEREWEGQWLPEMDETIGCIGTVLAVINQCGTVVVFVHERWYYYPSFVLKKETGIFSE